MSDKDRISLTLLVYPGDIITSKKGVLSESAMTGKSYIVKKLEVMGNGGFCAIEKENA